MELRRRKRLAGAKAPFASDRLFSTASGDYPTARLPSGGWQPFCFGRNTHVHQSPRLFPDARSPRRRHRAADAAPVARPCRRARGADDHRRGQYWRRLRHPRPHRADAAAGRKACRQCRGDERPWCRRHDRPRPADQRRPSVDAAHRRPRHGRRGDHQQVAGFAGPDQASRAPAGRVPAAGGCGRFADQVARRPGQGRPSPAPSPGPASASAARIIWSRRRWSRRPAGT